MPSGVGRVTRLPRSVDDLRGLRIARWIRESTTGQFDRYGPGAQRELQAGAIRPKPRIKRDRNINITVGAKIGAYGGAE